MNQLRHLALVIAGVLLVSSAALAQSHDSPRKIGIRAFEQILGTPDADLDSVLEKTIAPSLWERLGKKGVRDLIDSSRSTLAESKLRGARPISDSTARLLFESRSASNEVILTVESDPPYRIAGIQLIQPDDSSTTVPRDGARPAIAGAAAPDDLGHTIEAFVRKEAAEGRFSGSVIVARNGKPIASVAVGLADRDTGRRITLDTPINLASMNKMFTGLAVGMLVRQGKLGWNDSVGKYLPDYPNETVRDKVTIHQLLTHTSGIPSYWNAEFEKRKNEIISLEDFLSTFVNEPLLFEPGAGLQYSNGGPVVLGLIIEAVTGVSYYDWVRENIYEPAGMTHTDHYLETDTNAGLAIGYHREAPESPFVPNTGMIGIRGSSAGGGYSTANDLLRFSRALAGETLLSREWLEKLWSANRPGSAELGYGYLWGTGRVNGKRWVGHNGGAPGVSADFRFFPDDDITIVVLGNESRVAMPISSWISDLITRN